MRWELLLTTCVLIGCCAVEARADFVAQPNFTAEETKTIARNELLRNVVQIDPWLVRRVLDMLSGSAGVPRGPAAGLDPLANPDLSISPRDPQGVVEWNALIKRAKAEKEQRGKTIDPSMARSSEGSVELLDMMRRAKMRKANNGAP